MAKAKSTLAICYDFDGTLSPGNMQEYGFFTKLGHEAKKFWAKSAKDAKDHSADPILTYMRLMIQEAQHSKIPTSRKAFREYGETVELFPGVEDWFVRINEYGKQNSIAIEHYIVSSGLKEMIEGSAIAKWFKKVYACSFIYDANGAACWPAYAVNYTAKTQFLFRINKGIEDDSDNKTINEYVPDEERRIPFSRMIYIGDGLTDIPCMKLVKEKGGYAISVYGRGKGKKETSEKLLAVERVNFIASADYSEDKQLDLLVKRIIDRQAANDRLSGLISKPRAASRAKMESQQ